MTNTNSIFALEDEDLEFLDEENTHTFPLEKKSFEKQNRIAAGNQKCTNDGNDKDDKGTHSLNKNQFKFKGVKANNVEFIAGITSKNCSFDPLDDINLNDSDGDLGTFKKGQDMQVGHTMDSQSYGRKTGHTSKAPVSVPNLLGRTECSQVGMGEPNIIPQNAMRQPQCNVSKDHQRCNSQDLSSSLVKRKRKPFKRRFPGPAGVLPQIENVAQLGKMDPEVLNRLKSEKQLPGLKKPKSNASLMEASDPEDFKRDFWLKLQRDSIESCRGFIYHTISSIHQKASHHQLPKGKVPLMCALIKSFTANCTDASVILRDPTGEIKGTVHQQVLERNQTELVPGAGISLKQVSVFSPSPRKHYVNITPSNILYLIDPNANLDDLSQRSSQTVAKSDSSYLSSTAGGPSIDEKSQLSAPSHETNPRDQDEKALPTQSLIDDAVDDVLLDMDEDADFLAALL